MARFFLQTSALDPHSDDGVKTWTVGLEKKQIDRLLMGGEIIHKSKYARLELAVEVLAQPEFIFANLMRPDTEAYYCYCASPDRDCLGPGIKSTTPPPYCIFVVFVTESGKLHDWGWEKRDPENDAFPIDYQNRFGELLWPPK